MFLPSKPEPSAHRFLCLSDLILFQTGESRSFHLNLRQPFLYEHCQNCCCYSNPLFLPYPWITAEIPRCNNDLLIYKISSTCFGQYFAHHQERETEIFTAYGILLLRWVGRRWAVALHMVQRYRSPSTYPPQQQDTICCKYLSLTVSGSVAHSTTLPLTVYLPITTTGYHML